MCFFCRIFHNFHKESDDERRRRIGKVSIGMDMIIELIQIDIDTIRKSIDDLESIGSDDVETITMLKKTLREKINHKANNIKRKTEYLKREGDI